MRMRWRVIIGRFGWMLLWGSRGGFGDAGVGVFDYSSGY